MMPAIIGVLASRTPGYLYFTTVLYPILVEDSLAVSTSVLTGGSYFSMPEDSMSITNPTLQSGELTETIVYRTYDEPLATENLSVPAPTLQSGELAETIVYRTYNEPLATENLSISNPTLQSGDMPTVISYVNYNEPLATENLSISNPTLQSGTLI